VTILTVSILNSLVNDLLDNIFVLLALL